MIVRSCQFAAAALAFVLDQALHGGSVAAVALLTASAVGAGLTALSGELAAVVVPVLLVGATVWSWRRRPDRPTLVACGPVAGERSGPVDVPRWLATEPRASSDPGRFLAVPAHDPARPDGITDREGEHR